MKKETLIKMAYANGINPIIQEQTKYLAPVIANINLEKIKVVLHYDNNGVNWKMKKCNRADLQYKRFLHLQNKFSTIYFPIEVIVFMEKIHSVIHKTQNELLKNNYSFATDTFSILPFIIQWHSNVTDFRSYKFSKPLVYGYGNHQPIFAIRFKPWQTQIDERKSEVLEKFEETKKLYFVEFGEHLDLKNIC